MNINFQRPMSTEEQQEYIEILFIDCQIFGLIPRRDYYERVTGRQVKWSDELTRSEASQVIDQLKEQKENAKARRPNRKMEDEE